MDLSGINKDTVDHSQNVWIGVIAVVISCLSSGFAGVYFEKALKTSDSSGEKPSVWLRNVQLGIFGGAAAIIGMVIKDGSEIAENGFFQGYNAMVLFVVFQQAIGGLIVALVVKYADNILKGYATSLSIIISAIASIFLFSFSLTIVFGIGTGITIAAIFVYGYKPAEEAKMKQNGFSSHSNP